MKSEPSGGDHLLSGPAGSTGFGSISAAAAAAAAMFGNGSQPHELGPLGADIRLSHPAITQWLQQAQQAQQQQQQQQQQAQQQQQQQQQQQDSPPSNDEPMDRESSPHSSGGGGPGSDYQAL